MGVIGVGELLGVSIWDTGGHGVWLWRWEKSREVS